MKIVLNKAVRLCAGLIALCFLPAQAHACFSVLPLSGNAIQYDPSAAAPTIRQIQFQITEQCSADPNDTIVVQLFVSDDIEPQPFAKVGQVPFDIITQARSVLQTPIQPLRAPLIVPVKGTATVQLDLVLSPGIAAIDGGRQLSVVASAPGLGPEGDPRILDFNIELQALPVLSLKLADGRQTGRLDFGVLQAGAVRSADVLAEASVPFSIQFESTYDEVLRRAEPCGVPLPPTDDTRDRIAYRTRLNGRDINERTDYSDFSIPPGQIQTLQLPVSVEIDPTLEVGSKRAGDYCDVITLRIEPAN